MSLLDDVSIVVTPNGYKAGTLYGVLPTATEGAELVVNGDFSSGTSPWALNPNWSLGGVGVIADGTSNSTIWQSGVVEDNKQYIVTYTLTDFLQGSINVDLSGGNGITRTVAGTYTEVITSGTSPTTRLSFEGGLSFKVTLSNISVKEWTASDMDVTRATSATRVNEQGLIEEVPYNLLQQSNTFNTTWTLSSSIDLTSGQSGVGGSTDAWLLKRNSTGSRYIAQALSLSSAQYSFSVYLKAESTNWAYIWSYDGTTQNNAYFDLQNGVVGNTSGANFDGTKIESVGDGWYRCTLIYTQITTLVRIYPAYSNGNISIGTDNGIYIQYSQLEVGSTSKTYLPTTTRFNVPRIDYTGGGCPHILAEPQRTNLVTYSESISNLSRTTNGTGTLTITDNYTDSPQGLQNASRVQMSIVDTNDTSNYRLINAGSVMITGVTREISFYAKSLTGSNQDVLVYWSYDQQIVTLTNDWQRFKISATSGSSSKVFIGTRGGSGSYFSGGDANLDFALWGLQVEDDGSGGGSSYATSYIPTSGSTVTRNKDIFTRDGIGSLINDSEGVLFVEAKTTYDSSTSRRISLSDGSINNRVMLEFDETTENTIKAVITTGGVNSAIMTFAASDLSQYNKIAIKYKLNDFSIWFNGTEVVTDSSGGVPTGLTQLVLDGGDGSNFFYGEVKQLQVYNTALTDMQLIQLTGTAGTDFYESYSEMAESLTYTIQ